MPIINPLPQQFLTSDPGVGGRIKIRPEDFLVDELPLYEPSGAGEHLYLGIQKTGVSHGELIATLRKHFGVGETAIGFAGMKDKAAITRQTVSIHLLSDPPSMEIDHQRIAVLWATRHTNKIRRGHLGGNRFSIRIREVDPLKAPAALRVLRTLEKSGTPNYFGGQRFGYRRNNHLVGAALFKGDWNDAAKHLLGMMGQGFPEYQRERRELFDAGRFAEAAALWTAADRTERIVCNALARGDRPREAIIKVGGTAFSFWISALQSVIFNRVLDWRIEQGLFSNLIDGDLAIRHDSGGMFPVSEAELADGELDQRFKSLEVSPSGPLWGRGMRQPGPGRIFDIERASLASAGVDVEDILTSTRSPEGGRRTLRTIIRNIEADSGIDEHGPYIRMAFDLPRGAYATEVLREVMKTDVPSDDAEPQAAG